MVSKSDIVRASRRGGKYVTLDLAPEVGERTATLDVNLDQLLEPTAAVLVRAEPALAEHADLAAVELALASLGVLAHHRLGEREALLPLPNRPVP